MQKRRTNDKTVDALRLALSHLEKAQALSRESTQALSAGEISEERYRHLQDFYARHMQRAQERITHLRLEYRRRAEALRKELQEVAREQADTQGGARAERRSVRRLQELRSQYQHQDRLSKLSQSLELGGFIDLPLEQYGQAPVRVSRPFLSLERLGTTVVALVTSLAVFVPWLAMEGQTRTFGGVLSLPHMDALGNQAWMSAFLLVLGVSLPLLAAVFAWLESPIVGGRGQIATGVVIALLPVLVVLAAVLATMDTLPLVRVLAGLRAGAITYFAGGLMQALLGRRRLRGQEEPQKAASTLLAILALAGVAAVSAYALGALEPSAAGITFRVGPGDRVSGVAPITCSNEGGLTVRLYAPWPGGVPGGPLVEETRNAYGTALWVREQGSREFRLYPASEGSWTRQGVPAATGTPIEIGPGTTVTLELDPRLLRNAGLRPEAVRVEISDSRGRRLESYEFKLPPA